MMIDTHAHLTSDTLFPQVEELLKRAADAGVDKIVNICTDPTTLERGLALTSAHPLVFHAGATTPHDVEKEGEMAFPVFEKAARDGRLIAIGETGLDYYYEHSNRILQQEFLIRYLHLAKEVNLPVIIHCRDAFSDLFAIADREYGESSLVLHCFTGNYDEAKQVIDRGWLLSLSGIMTFKKSVELQETARKIPLEHLVIETDAPYLAPMPYRGKQNEPSYVIEVAKMLAELKGISFEEVARVTSANASSFFNF